MKQIIAILTILLTLVACNEKNETTMGTHQVTINLEVHLHLEQKQLLEVKQLMNLKVAILKLRLKTTTFLLTKKTMVKSKQTQTY